MMKNISLLLIILLSFTSCKCTAGKDTDKETRIISKVHHKNGIADTDTLWVSQNDSTVFKREEYMVHRPCSDPELQVSYELIQPKDGAYYFIYNDVAQLVQEGIYSAKYTYEDKTSDRGGFYNGKKYSYKDNGKLVAIHYSKDGYDLKRELFNRKGELTEMEYYKKGTMDTRKIEIYKKGKLQETRVYKGFASYYVVKPEENYQDGDDLTEIKYPDRTEYYDLKRRLIEIKYYKPNTKKIDKIEIYNKGKLKETHIYIQGVAYQIVKAK